RAPRRQAVNSCRFLAERDLFANPPTRRRRQGAHDGYHGAFRRRAAENVMRRRPAEASRRSWSGMLSLRVIIPLQVPVSRVIFSENRLPLFGITRQPQSAALRIAPAVAMSP